MTPSLPDRKQSSARGPSGPVSLVLAWIFESDLTERSRSSPSFGGVRQGYNLTSRDYPFVYSEITGYAISTAVNAFRWTGDQRQLDSARSAAQFLLDIQAEADERVAGAFPHSRSIADGAVHHEYYSFDAAMCIQGLLDLWEIDRSAALLEAATRAGDWLIDQMQFEDGAFRALFDVATGKSEHPLDEFYFDRGSLHVKHAICLLKLASATGDPRYTRAAREVCDWVLELQDADGAFCASDRSSEVVSHAHAYATEGLLFSYRVLEQPDYLEAAMRAGQFLLDAQLRDGSIAVGYKQGLWRNFRPRFDRLFPVGASDATAQAIRIWLILREAGRLPEARAMEAARAARRFLLERQVVDTQDANARGGIVHIHRQPMMFAWSAMFAAQALHALDQIEHGQDASTLVEEIF